VPCLSVTHACRRVRHAGWWERCGLVALPRDDGVTTFRSSTIRSGIRGEDGPARARQCHGSAAPRTLLTSPIHLPRGEPHACRVDPDPVDHRGADNPTARNADTVAAVATELADCMLELGTVAWFRPATRAAEGRAPARVGSVVSAHD
jgi:hypothetical protein